MQLSRRLTRFLDAFSAASETERCDSLFRESVRRARALATPPDGVILLIEPRHIQVAQLAHIARHICPGGMLSLHHHLSLTPARLDSTAVSTSPHRFISTPTGLESEL